MPPPTASAAIRLSTDSGVTYGSPGVKAQYTAGQTLYAKLDSIANVGQVAWSVVSTDGTSLPGSFSLATSGVVGEIVHFAVDVAGTCGLLRAQVNAGIGPYGNADFNVTTSDVKWWVPAANGAETGAASEGFESDPVLGTTAIVNGAVRGSAGAGAALSGATLHLTGTLQVDGATTLGAAVNWSSTVATPAIGQTQLAGTGSTAGVALALQAQKGQQQTGGAANTNGGSLALKGGAAGTGGGGAAGVQGPVTIQGGGLTVTLDSTGLQIPGGIIGGLGIGGALAVSSHITGADVSVSGSLIGSSVTASSLAQSSGTLVLGVSTGFISLNSTGIGLYSATPVAQPSRVGQLTDSTGGVVTTTLAAGITDSVAKNAIASLAAKVNALETALHNLGVTA